MSEVLRDPRYAQYASFIEKLNQKWKPTPKQTEIGRLLYVEGKRRIFVEAGRKLGKSEIACDIIWRLGNMIKDGQMYYFGAYQKAVREFIWANSRLQSHGPKDYVKSIHKNEMRITFTSNTFCKCEGADEFAVSKGFTPDVVILDEFADYPDEFWHAMSPNFAPKDCIVIIISSPPWTLERAPGDPVLFCRIADEWKRLHAIEKQGGKKTKYSYVHGTIYDNPHISKEWIEQERSELIAMGLEDIWLREYMAKRVVGGGRRVVGTFERDRHMIPHDELMKKIEKDKRNLLWLTGCDPGNSTVFATLLAAINPYTKELFFLDEIYEKQEDETMATTLWPRIKAKEDELYPGDDPNRFERVYDEEAKWWSLDVLSHFNIAMNPTQKAANSKEMGLSILRTAFRFDKAYLSDRCQWFAWELENLKKDKNGKVPKKNDHLVDTSRYIVHEGGYFINEEDKPVKESTHPRYQKRTIRPEEEFGDIDNYEDAFYRGFDNVGEEYVDEDKWN